MALQTPLSSLSVLVASLLLMGAATPAFADVTYTGTGFNYADVSQNDDPPAGMFTESMKTRGYVTLSAPVLPGITFSAGHTDPKTVVAFQFNDGRTIYDLSNSDAWAFTMALDGSGEAMFGSGVGATIGFFGQEGVVRSFNAVKSFANNASITVYGESGETLGTDHASGGTLPLIVWTFIEDPTECSDGLDNDGDGAIDLADVDCPDANHDKEKGPTCVDGVVNQDFEDCDVDWCDEGTCRSTKGTCTTDADCPRDDSMCPGACSACQCPDICGNNEWKPPFEQCDGTKDDRCPGLCIAPGQPNECKCPPPVCGDNHVNRSDEQCDGTDDSNCLGQCNAECQCPAGACEPGPPMLCVTGAPFPCNLGWRFCHPDGLCLLFPLPPGGDDHRNNTICKCQALLDREATLQCDLDYLLFSSAALTLSTAAAIAPSAPVGVSQIVDVPSTPTTFSFDYVFAFGDGELLVFLGDQFLGPVIAPPSPDGEILTASFIVDGALLGQAGLLLRVELDGTVNTSIALDNLSFPGLVNGDFETGDLTGWEEESGDATFAIVIPEPSSSLMLIAGAGFLAGLHRRRTRRSLARTTYVTPTVRRCSRV